MAWAAIEVHSGPAAPVPVREVACNEQEFTPQLSSTAR